MGCLDRKGFRKTFIKTLSFDGISYYHSVGMMIVVVASHWIFKTMPVLVFPMGRVPALPTATRPTTTPRPRHGYATHQTSVSPAKERAQPPNSASGEHGEAPSRGRVARSLGLRGISGEERGFRRIRHRLLPRDLFFLSPIFGVHLYGRRCFFGDGTL